MKQVSKLLIAILCAATLSTAASAKMHSKSVSTSILNRIDNGETESDGLFSWLKMNTENEVVKPSKPLPRSHTTSKKKYRLARVTFYDPNQDKWGSQVACPRTPRAKEGVTVAAHKSVPFGTKVEIPGLKGIVGDGVFEVQDRGSAVNSKRADYKYGRNVPVIDVYVSSSSKRRALTYKVPDYMQVSL